MKAKLPEVDIDKEARRMMDEAAKERSRENAYNLLAENPLLWGHVYFKNHFSKNPPKFHGQLASNAVKEQYLAVAAPRGSAKSTILAFLVPFHSIVFKQRRFILIIANTFKKAALHLDAMKIEIRDNQSLKEAFPGISITKDAEGDSVFRHRDGYETKVLCRGVDQIGSIRGVKFGAYRPDLIIGDDMEDDILVRNPMRRIELQNLYDEALIPAGEPGLTKYIMIGTILHDDCQIAKLTSRNHYPEYKKLFFQALSDGETSLWPERWTREDLLNLKNTKPEVFAKEYQNNPVAGLMARFKKEDFRRYSISGSSYTCYDEFNAPIQKGIFKECRAAIACDLAWSEKRDADNCVIMPGLLTPESDLLVYPYFCEKGVRPDKFIEHLFSLVIKLEALTGSPVPVGFEKAMLENVTQWILKKEMRKRNKFIITKELKWDGDKISRIENRLQPRYSQNTIFHTQSMGDLEYQLTRFPSGTHDDLPDALQGLVQLLQYPKQTKVEKKEDLFDTIRKITIEAKTKPRKPKIYGRRSGARFNIPANLALPL